ncbi:Flp pilus assembly protein TadD [Roseibium hamelinense]|uniref:Flp pilus assembly protein TadD n=1 Tax=Roseibium hamelinense TaxID=150831 RepID=A0A562SIK6_9HYPH|nr:tetratricopeptide repeat protein [Roseibium hamelinense]MTI43911.1 tetratricopeptide repeat protein [Roseibium hamelinense]TWI80794.1 Flp pilus assembly protein TadD [Roseibium hamelinense]
MGVATHSQRRVGLKALRLGLVLSAAVIVSACASSKNGGTGTHSATPNTAYVAPGSTEARQQVARWTNAYTRNEKDRSAILGYANALQRNGQITQAMAVLRSAVITYPNDREISSAYGKVLAMNGMFDEALNVLQRAQTPETPDWKLMSAEAAVHDQLGQHQQARALYNQALKIVPNEPTLLNNLALSYLLTDDLPKAEYTLKKAAALPTADSRIRQNLALVLGLQGKFDQAIQVAQAEIDPKQAEANIAYLRQMLQKRQQG